MSEAQEPLAREHGRLRLFMSHVNMWFVRLRRKFPYLVWYGDEVDVRVTLMEDQLDSDNPFGSFYSGSFHEIEKQLHELGIEFDRGLGFDGRDWQWDWSLKGPISVRFRGRAKHPEKRREIPRPRLVVSNTEPAA